MLSRASFCGLWSVLFGLIGPVSALAGGLNIADIGARGMARGGAFIANPDSLLAIHYNPAALSRLRGAHAEGALALVDFDYSFQRKCPCVDPAIAGVARAAELDAELESRFARRSASSNQLGPQSVPFAGIAYGFEPLDLTIAFAAYGPMSPAHWKFGELTLPSSQPQRFSAVEVELFEARYALAVALSPIEGLRIGGSAILYSFRSKTTAHLWTNSDLLTPQGPEDPDQDVTLDLEFSRAAAANWSLGISYDIFDWLVVGASVLGKRSIRADGTADLGLPEKLDGFLEIKGNAVQAEANIGPIWRAGVEARRDGIGAIELAAVYERWSSYEGLRVRAENSAGEKITINDAPLATIDIPFGLDDTFSVRLGGELYLFEPYLGLRAGAFFEPSAVPVQKKDVATPDLDKFAFTLGLATTWYGVTVELAGAYVALQTLDVTNSERRLFGAQGTTSRSDELLTIIGNIAKSFCHK